MGAFRYLVVLIVIHILTAGSVKVSPKLDFGDQSELIQIKKETISGKIKGLRVTVDTSELKGFLLQSESIEQRNKFFVFISFVVQNRKAAAVTVLHLVNLQRRKRLWALERT